VCKSPALLVIFGFYAEFYPACIKHVIKMSCQMSGCSQYCAQRCNWLTFTCHTPKHNRRVIYTIIALFKNLSTHSLKQEHLRKRKENLVRLSIRYQAEDDAFFDGNSLHAEICNHRLYSLYFAYDNFLVMSCLLWYVLMLSVIYFLRLSLEFLSVFFTSSCNQSRRL